MLAAACSKYKYETVAGDPLNTRIYTLDNGLKVYMSVNKEAPRIQTYIAVKVGGKNDPAETTGLAHYFEHLMFKGTQQFGTSDYAAEKPMLDEIESLFEVYRKTADEAERAAIYRRIDSISYEASKIAIPNEYDKLMSAIGANGTNAFTSQDMTVYVEDIPSNQIDNWAKIQADRFKNPVIRGFHTELETIYEEKNMSLTQDSRKVWEAMDAALFPNHPYGTQTVLGTQEHLKNPSITNVRNYHKTYYVPNNMAVCVSGDFEPDEMVATIEKYFGDMQPNPNLPELQFEPEKPITTPVVKEVYGLEAANVMLGWRLPGANDKSTDISDIVGSILYNGQAGLIDLDLNQQQKVLSAYGYASTQPDYSSFLVAGRPKTGQSLDEVRDLLLEEVAKLRRGDFDEKLIEATINNYKMQLMRSFEENDSRAILYVYSFISGADWADEVARLDRMSKITKQDVVEWANKYLGPESYAIIYKREGKDPDEQKIAAPKITPIVTNRDSQSEFLSEIQTSQVQPIEPVFVDYKKDMSQFEAQPGIDVLYKKNETNDIFTLIYVFNTGTENDPALNLAFNYLSYLGTDKMTAEEIASEMYDIACSFYMNAGANQSSIQITGLSENMGKAMEIVEGLIAGAKPDEAILENCKADMLKSRADAKLNQSRCFGALQRYLFYGGDFIRRTTLTDPALQALTSGAAARQNRRPDGQTARSALLRPAERGRSQECAGETPQGRRRPAAAGEEVQRPAAHRREQGRTGSVRRQTALLPAVLEPRREIRRGSRSRNHALQRIFRRRHEHHRLPRDARGARSGVHGMGHPRYAEQRQRRLQLLRLHRHAERQDAKSRRSVRRHHQQHARIGKGVRHRQGSPRLAPAYRAHGQRRRIVELSPRPRSGPRRTPRQADFREGPVHDARRRESRPAEVGQRPQIRLRHSGRHSGPRSQLPENPRSHSDRIAGGDFRLLTRRNPQKRRTPQEISCGVPVFSMSGTANGGRPCRPWRSRRRFSRSSGQSSPSSRSGRGSDAS